MGPDHVPTRGSLVYGFCNSLWSRLKAEKKSGRRNSSQETSIMRWTWGPDDCNNIPPWKGWNGSYFTRAKRTSELHDLLSRQHRLNREGIQVPVGDISKGDGWRVNWEDQVPAFSTWCTAQFLLNSNDIAAFQIVCALSPWPSLRALHS